MININSWLIIVWYCKWIRKSSMMAKADHNQFIIALNW